MKHSHVSSCAIKRVVVASAVSCLILFSGSHLAVAQTTSATVPRVNDTSDYQTGAVLWTQSSAEYRALAYQTFTLARLRLDQDLRQQRARRGALRRPAVIVDVDETVLDNTRYQAELVLRGLSFDPETWRAWCERAEAGAVPGAVDFLKYAASRGVSIFYITNRSQAEKAGTIANLRKLGFPDPSEATLMVREDHAPSSKESRRISVAAHFRTLLLIGDTLSDFSDHFSAKTAAQRAAQVDRERAEFGVRYIVVPNPMYGDWENAIYENKSGLTDAQKRAHRRAALQGL